LHILHVSPVIIDNQIYFCLFLVWGR